MSTIKCISPVDGSVYAERAAADEGDIERTFSAARSAQTEWAKLPLEARARFCLAVIAELKKDRARIGEELTWQMGRPIRYTGNELNGVEERVTHMVKIAPESLADRDEGTLNGAQRVLRRDPLGVVFTIAPWNYPYLTACNSIFPALMAGNTVVLKHAAQTLLVAERFQDAFDRAGVPRGVFQHLFLTHDQTARIIASRLANMVCFTGSVEGGAAIERAAAGTFINVGLELGGKDPAYVRADANLPFAIENIADGAFFNSGQCCCGVERVYVDASVYDDFVSGIVELTRGYALGNPLEQATTLGPMVKTSAAEFVRGQIDGAVRAGAQCHLDPRSFAADRPGTPYLAPQVLTGVNHQMDIMTQETFGPAVGIMKVSDDEEAIQLMNDSRYGLTASVWTEDMDAARAIGERIETGTVYMNRCDYLDPALAWTGVKDTGRGITLSRAGYEVLTRPKSFYLRHSS